MSVEPLIVNIERSTLNSSNYRQVIYTSKHMQLALMSLDKGVEIGWEQHNGDQFIRVEGGTGMLQLKMYNNIVSYPLSDGVAFIVPSNTRHNVINTGLDSLKIYTIYSPPQHRPGTVDVTRPLFD